MENFGNVNRQPDHNLVEKYNNHSIKDLKKALNKLKSTTSDLTEIKYVSRILCTKFGNHSNTHSDVNRDDSLNHDRYIDKNF